MEESTKPKNRRERSREERFDLLETIKNASLDQLRFIAEKVKQGEIGPKDLRPPDLPAELLTIEQYWPQMDDRIVRIVMSSDAKRAVPAFLAAAKMIGKGEKAGDRGRGDTLNLNVMVNSAEGRKELVSTLGLIDHEPGEPEKVR